jgi:hypothetical protein
MLWWRTVQKILTLNLCPAHWPSTQIRISVQLVHHSLATERIFARMPSPVLIFHLSTIQRHVISASDSVRQLNTSLPQELEARGWRVCCLQMDRQVMQNNRRQWLTRCLHQKRSYLVCLRCYGEKIWDWNIIRPDQQLEPHSHSSIIEGFVESLRLGNNISAVWRMELTFKNRASFI